MYGRLVSYYIKKLKHLFFFLKFNIFQIGCLMYEVFTCGKMPYGGNTTNSIAAKQIISGIIPEKPIYCPSSLYDNVLIKAWSKVRLQIHSIISYLINNL